MKSGILVSHPFGNANVRQAALAFAETDCLAGFRTCISWPENSPLAAFLPAPVLSQLERRTFPSKVAAKTRTQPFRELARLVSTRLGWNQWIAHESGPFSVDAVSQSLDASVAKELRHSSTPPAGIYAYEDGAAASFAAAKERNIKCLYDLPIGYWKASRAIQIEEAELQPEWAGTLTAIIDSEQKVARKDAELAAADAIIVASQFTARTLTDHSFDAKKICIIPYGCPAPEREPTPRHDGPLRILFVGSLGQRKGTSYLLSAVEQLGKHATLTLLGSRPVGPCAPLDRALQTHRWVPSLAHGEVLQEMRQHDVLVFPSLFEGFGLVITEALSQGIPIITTRNTAGPDLLTEGEDGYVVPIRDAAALEEKLALLLSNPEHLQSMKAAALRKAKLFTWERYRSTLVEQVSRILP
ncbi:MAG TPA: glycosyltransferase family 4 protein [Chthoniobacterales bacterium]|jgi:glycosyltransferase involved in cell wall biosynthesis